MTKTTEISGQSHPKVLPDEKDNDTGTLLINIEDTINLDIEDKLLAEDEVII